MMQEKVSGALEDVKRAVDGAEETVHQSRKAYGSLLLFRGLFWMALYVISMWLLTERPAATGAPIESAFLRVAIALLPLPFFGWWLWTWMKGVLHLDELQRRIELEALAFAFPTSLLFLATMGLLDVAVPMAGADFNLRHLWLMMPMLYYIGLWLAQRRYA
ncbi:MAG TPA: hypothetical protein VJ691_13990 [Vicinamibacterales bacterium]|nr:hypothetical protein [Vicinamibacterales bacterium]